MRELVADYLERRLSRRGFIQALMAAGVTASAAQNVLAAIVQDSAGAQTARQVTGTGGELIVEQLKAAGIDIVFANPGSTETGFYDALVDAPVHLIMGLHEGIVISMADGYHQASGKPAFVNVHAVVGTAQMGGQLANAHLNNTPVVITAGMPDVTTFNDQSPLGPRQMFAQSDVPRQFTKIAWDARNAASLPLALRRAIKIATTPPGGPVYLAIATEALNARNVTSEIIDQSEFNVPMRVRPNREEVERVARWLIEAKRPTLMVGRLPLTTGASRQAVAIAELLGVPVMTGNNGFEDLDGGFPTRHPLHYDAAAMRAFGRKDGPNPFAGCDLLIGLGKGNFQGATLTAPSVFGTAGYLSPSARKVGIGVDVLEMARTEPLTLAMVADLEEGLHDLVDAVKSLATTARLASIRSDRYGTITDEIAGFRRRMDAAVAANVGKTPMHPDEVTMLVDNVLEPDAITVHENYSHDNDSYCRPLLEYGPGKKLRIGPAGSLGWGVGAAIGAKIAQPDRQVMLAVGDGALMYSAAGFWTMARYRVPVLTIVYNNYNYQIVRHRFDDFGGRMKKASRYPGMYLGDPSIDFPMLAKSQGVSGERVANATDLAAALRRGMAATKAGQPYLIEVIVGRTGAGAQSTWHETYNVATQRTRLV